MNEKQLREHLQALHMPALGIAYVIQAATTDPAKTVFHGNRQSVAEEYHSSIPVSYTHLDVYKRQGYQSESCRHCIAFTSNTLNDVLRVLS